MVAEIELSKGAGELTFAVRTGTCLLHAFSTGPVA